MPSRKVCVWTGPWGLLLEGCSPIDTAREQSSSRCGMGQMQSAPDQRSAEIAPEAGNDQIVPAGGRHLAVDVAQRALAHTRLELCAFLAGLEHQLAGMEGFETGPMADADQRGAGQL